MTCVYHSKWYVKQETTFFQMDTTSTGIFHNVKQAHSIQSLEIVNFTVWLWCGQFSKQLFFDSNLCLAVNSLCMSSRQRSTNKFTCKNIYSRKITLQFLVYDGAIPFVSYLYCFIACNSCHSIVSRFEHWIVLAGSSILSKCAAKCVCVCVDIKPK